MRPDHGGRLEFKLRASCDLRASYVLTVFTAEREQVADVDVGSADGAIQIGPWQGGPPPEWLSAIARALLRTIWRAQQSDGSWPRRVTRWRPAPKA